MNDGKPNFLFSVFSLDVNLKTTGVLIPAELSNKMNAITRNQRLLMPLVLHKFMTFDTNCCTRPRIGFGVELFSNFRVKPWLYITPDIQFIRPGLGALTSGDKVFIYGLRMNIKL